MGYRYSLEDAPGSWAMAALSAMWYRICICRARCGPARCRATVATQAETMQNDSSDDGPAQPHPAPSNPISRRGFIQATVATLGGIAAPLGTAGAAPAAKAAPPAVAAAIPVTLRING